MNKEQSTSYVESLNLELARVRDQYSKRSEIKEYINYNDALKNRAQIAFSSEDLVAPKQLGREVIKDIDISEFRSYIDWTPFFSSWMLKGKFPAILDNEIVGEEARKLYKDANLLLDRIIENKELRAHAVIGIYKAWSQDDTVSIVDENGEIRAFEFLRQQRKKAEGLPNYSLSDFIAPKNNAIEDHLGFFAVTAGDGIEDLIAQFEHEHDDYQVILVKAVADRLAEALAEFMHERIRKEKWAYDSGESLSNEELIKESYRGIRPAPGYPACPDHTEKIKLFDLLKVEKSIGIRLTESCAMYPASSVSGYYFANPASRYFNVAQVSEDQIVSYSKRKDMSKADIERWLQSNINY